MAAIDISRARALGEGTYGPGPVIYAMARDQRAEDNWALLYARQLAREIGKPLIVACPLAADYPTASRRQIDFMRAGLAEVERRLAELRIPLVVAAGDAADSLLELIRAVDASAAVCDFNPLRESRTWKAALAKRARISLFEVDAHNVVPCWEVSDKQEYAAYTIRPKINRLLGQYLIDFPALEGQKDMPDLGRFPAGWTKVGVVPQGDAHERCGIAAGGEAAWQTLQSFLDERFAQYDETRNDPTKPGQSGLSPYLHFGQIAAQRVALEAQRTDFDVRSQEAFTEELIVRRELADNYCLYNDRYDSYSGFPGWAQATLDDHRGDPRAYLYGRDQLEAAETHDELWNAAQRELVDAGKMHGYMRMYWAKKILEWSVAPEAALEVANYLNNEYELDGNDPNGYTGVAWSIGGVHDRAWSERQVFGKIRYMSAGGCRRKFAVDRYVEQHAPANHGLQI